MNARICRNSELDWIVDGMRSLASRADAAERSHRSRATSIPDDGTKISISAQLFALLDRIERDVKSGLVGFNVAQLAWERVVGPWFYRSELFWRARFKPNGHAGDYRLIEALCDLEGSAANDSTRSFTANLLDHVASRIHSTMGIWDRRAMFAGRVRSCLEADRPMRILDMAGGGARHLHDALTGRESSAPVVIVLIDQDPAALAFAAARFARVRGVTVAVRCVPANAVLEEAGDDDCDYDLILAAGLLDHSSDVFVRALLDSLSRRLTRAGALLVSSSHPADRSDFLRRLTMDWHSILRAESDLKWLFPRWLATESWLSDDGSLSYALGTR